MLSARDLTTAYEGLVAISDVSIDVAKGEVVCVAGANGAGKSTLLKTIAGAVRPRSGSVTFDGTRIDGVAQHLITARGIAYVPENRRLFPSLTVDDNLRLGSYLYRGKADRDEPLALVFQLFPRLKERLDQLAGTLSGGEQQMLAIGRALVARPRLLLLDEPSLGLAPKFVTRIFLTLRELRQEGKTILLVEQNARQALQVADRGYVMERGRIVLTGSGAELLNTPEVRQTYLGQSAA